MSSIHTCRWRVRPWSAVAIIAATLVLSPGANGQVREPAAVDVSTLDSLIARALVTSPSIRAATARLDAARAHVAPAGLRADPMLMVGVQNLPVSDPGFRDDMTMKMLGISQSVPYPGKLRLQRRTAEHELTAAHAGVDQARLVVARELRSAYYDLIFTDQALEIVRRNQEMLAALIPVSEAHYSSGTGAQADVLRLRVEAARLADEATVLSEERRAALARLNAALNQPSDVPIGRPTIPERIRRAAVRDSARSITFVSPALGSRVANSPIPTLDSLQSLAIRQNPALRAHEAMIAAQATRAELARKEHLPDFDLSLQYGQRDRFVDMVSAIVSIPLPLQKGRKQDAQAAEVRSELAALEAEHHTMRNELAAKVVELHGALERGRSQLALYVKAILPQARAALSSATTGYQVGRVDFISLLEAQATVFQYETQYHRALTDFAKTLALLEEQVGSEVLR